MVASLKTLLNRPSSAGRGAVFTFGLRIVSTGLTFVTSLVLTHLLGTRGYGTYATALEWLTFLTVPTALGMDRFMVREIAIFRAQGKWDKLRGFLRWGNLAVLTFSLVVAGAGAILVTYTIRDRDALRLSLYFILAALPLMSLTTLRQAAMRGFDHIVGGQWPELVFTARADRCAQRIGVVFTAPVFGAIFCAVGCGRTLHRDARRVFSGRVLAR